MIDAQIGHEKTITSMLPALSGANFIYGMGMLEMGMVMSYEQLLIDAEIVRMTKRVLQGISVNDVTLAVDLIKKIGPAGTYLPERHTLQNMRRESSEAKLIDRHMYDSWLKKGGKDMAERANEKAREIYENHKPEPLPENIKKAIHAIVEEAEEEYGIR